MDPPTPYWLARGMYEGVRLLVERDPDVEDDPPVLDIMYDETLERWD